MVYDSFIFYNANIRNAAKISKILRVYEECSGQKINFEKATIFFNKSTTNLDKDEIIVELGQLHRNDLGNYLRLPAVIDRSKKKC